MDRIPATFLGAGLSPLERQVADTLTRLDPAVAPEVLVATILASRALGEGHLCLDLGEVVARPLFNLDGEPVPGWAWPALDRWTAALAASPLVAGPGGRAPLILSTDGGSPVVHLGRADAIEARLAAALDALARAPLDAGAPVDAAALFDDPDASAEQVEAVRRALPRRLFVLAGGPGTGKTTTVVRLLAALVSASPTTPRILMAAPTGKAAARMAESVDRERARLVGRVPAAVLDAIPSTASTLHRALGAGRDWRTTFRYGDDPSTDLPAGAGERLPADIVLVDEVSMVEAPLLTRLLSALRPAARVILLGDPEQLPSVGVGAVLGDICALPADSPVGSCVHRLTRSRRFDAGGPVGRVARAIRDADLDAVRAALDHPDARLHVPRGRPDRDAELLAACVEGWRPFCEATAPEARLDALERFRVLCATRSGPGGVVRMGEAIEDHLGRTGLIPRRRRGWYDGQPILVTTNDYDTELYNGDVGVVARDGAGLRAWFGPPGRRRSIPVGRLPQHETVWTMTIHKSQGSEADGVIVVLPDGDHRVLGRELLYTAVTRARARVLIAARPEVLAATIHRRAHRASTLPHRLTAFADVVASTPPG